MAGYRFKAAALQNVLAVVETSGNELDTIYDIATTLATTADIKTKMEEAGGNLNQLHATLASSGVFSTGSLVNAPTGGSGGLTAQETRDAMKLAPSAGAPAAGSIDKHLDDLPADTNTAIAAAHGVGSYLSASAGTGSLAIVLHAQDSLGAPILGVVFAVYDALTGLTYQAGGTSDVSGNVTVYLNAGAYKIVKTKQGSFTFTNPEAMTITVAATVNFVGTVIANPTPVANCQLLYLYPSDVGAVVDSKALIYIYPQDENEVIAPFVLSDRLTMTWSTTRNRFEASVLKTAAVRVEARSRSTNKPAINKFFTITSDDVKNLADYL
jgi:hypothetical protein